MAQRARKRVSPASHAVVPDRLTAPRPGYFLADGARVPSVTTVIGRFKDSGGLIHWAWAQGKAGKDYREERAQAADAGTLAHALVERHSKGEAATPEALGLDPASETWRAAEAAFVAYRAFQRETRLVIYHQELRLVSERLRVGGTVDAIGTIDGALCLIDWKTSNALYNEHLIQLAAYGALWAETHPDEPLAGGFHLCRFARDTGALAHHHWPELNEAREAFALMRRLYDLDARLKKKAA